MKRLMIFVDHSNIYLAAFTKKIRIDWKKLAVYLSESWLEEYDFNRCIMYGSVDESRSEDERKKQYNVFNVFDNYNKFDVKILPFDGRIQKGEKMVDVQIAVDMVMLASRNAFDVAILCSGDADFVPAVNAVMDLGKEVYVAGFESSLSWELKRASLGYMKLDNIKEIIYTEHHENSVPPASPAPVQKQSVKGRITRLLEEIGTPTTSSDDELIAKTREVLAWFENDYESKKELERKGIHLSVINDALKHIIPNFNQTSLGFTKFGEFLQFACNGTSLRVVRFAAVEGHPSETRIALRSRIPLGCDVLPDLDGREIHSTDSCKAVTAEHNSPISAQLVSQDPAQEQSSKSYINRLADEIGILSMNNDDEWIAKAREVLSWFENDIESYKELGRDGLHLSVIQEALRLVIPNFDQVCLGFPEFGEFLQFACSDTSLHVIRCATTQGHSFEARVTLRYKIPAGSEVMPDLGRREIHSMETYEAILADPGGPNLKLPSRSAIFEIANWISQRPFIETDLNSWIGLAKGSLNSTIDSEAVRSAFMAFGAAGVFHCRAQEGVPLEEQRLLLPEDRCSPGDILYVLHKAAHAKIESRLCQINQEVRLEVLQQLIPHGDRF